jgi:cytosine/adenosine deaminase-related metal-dependent hydrolase
MRTLISDAVIVTNDDQSPVLVDGAVMMEQDRIVDVGETINLRRRYQDYDRHIDGSGKILMPGLVSSHTHVGYTVFRGRVEDGGRNTFLTQLVPMAGLMTAAERLALGSLTYLELLRGGVTTIVEVEEDADLFPDFVEQLGARSFIGVMVQDVEPDRVVDGTFAYSPQMRRAQVSQALQLAEHWHNAKGRIRPLLMANSTMTSSPELMRDLREAADRLRVPLCIHLGTGTAERELCAKKHGKSPYAYARDLGLLGADVLAAHCFDITPEDIDILAETRTHIAHCPQINAVRGLIAPARALQDRGLNITLGIDNYFADFFEVLRSAIIVARIKDGDGTVMKPETVLKMATINGARALGLTDVGKIKPGWKADLILLDRVSPGLTPLLDPIPSLVYHAHSGSVRTVIVDGDVVVADGRATKVDEDALFQEAQNRAVAAWSRFIDRYGGINARLNPLS